MAYWLDLFTIETWREFKQAGGQISGFRESRWVRVKKMQPGDRLLCYIVGLKRWVGVLKVVGDPWNGTEPAIWQSDTFPARVNVEIELELAPETGVPAVDLIPEMPMFDKLDGMRGWGAFFMGSPALWQDVDGDIVVKAIQSAIESPVSRPIPRSAMRKRPRTIETPDLGTVAIPEAEDDEESGQSLLEKTAPPEREHTEIQALLARMGRAMGHDVFIARNDRSQTWQSKPLSELPGVVDTLPTHFNEATDRVVELIDVLWLDDNAIAAAFEVERSTVIYSGLLRMSDLLVMQPNLDIPIFLVAPEDRRLHVQREVNRPSFKAMKTKKPLRQACRFISFESLRDAAERYRDVLPHLKASWFRSELSESCELDDA